MKEHKCHKCNREFGSNDALNMHNQTKHPELHKKPMLSNKHRKKIRNYTIIFLLLIAVAGFIYWWMIPPKDAPIIEIIPATYDFGTVRQSLGVVSGMVTINNIGNKDLILTNMDTSCGCTSASIVYDGIEGPRFSMSMHGTNPKNWRQTIPPNGSAQLKVYYDPNVHKDLRGPVSRTVSISSNAPRHSRSEVRINAIQVD